jgi:hypothetical protein
VDDVIGPDEEAFLRAHSRAFLLGLRSDGSPTGWPMVAFYSGDALEFSTYRRSQKVRDYERNPSAGCVIAPSDSGRALVMQGRADAHDQQRSPTMGSEVPADARAKVRASQEASGSVNNPKRLIVRFTPMNARFVPGFAVGDGPGAG